MSVTIRFDTRLFDVTQERPNPHNPIFGESLLRWLARALAPQRVVGQPEPEDWGWFAHLDWDGQPVMLGASAESDAEGEEREWILQVVPQRSLKQRLLGQHRITPEHPLVQHLAEVLRREPAFTGIAVEGEP